jgi:hypothetical protein
MLRLRTEPLIFVVARQTRTIVTAEKMIGLGFLTALGIAAAWGVRTLLG